jgi:predicted nucleic acid-binding protein
LISFVLDNSMTMAWCFADEATPRTEGILNQLSAEHELLVPVLWPYEVGNILWRAVRKGRISSARVQGFLEELDSFKITIDDGTPYALTAVYRLADLHGFPATRLECRRQPSVYRAHSHQHRLRAPRKAIAASMVRSPDSIRIVV